MPASADSKAARRPLDKLSLLHNHVLFRDLPPPIIERIGSYMKIRKIPRGTTLFTKGDPGTGLIGVLQRQRQDQRRIRRRPRHRLQYYPRGRDFRRDCAARRSSPDRRCDRNVGLRTDGDRTAGFYSIPAQSAGYDAQVHRNPVRAAAAHQRTGAGPDLPEFADAPGQDTAATDVADRGLGIETQGRDHATRDSARLSADRAKAPTSSLRAWAKRGWIALDRGGVTVLAPDQLTGIAEAGLELDGS